MGTGAEFENVFIVLGKSHREFGACPHIVAHNLGQAPNSLWDYYESPNYLRRYSWIRKLLKKD